MTSSKSTDSEPVQQTDLNKIGSAPASPKDQQIAKIENDLQGEKDSRKEERFVWVTVVIILVDMIAFRGLDFGQMSMIVVLELIMLVVFARMCGIDDILVIMDRVFSWVSDFRSKGK